MKKEELGETFLAQRSQSRLGSRRSCNKELQPQKTGPKYSKNLQEQSPVLQHAATVLQYTMSNLYLPRSLTSDPSSVVILSAFRSTDQRIVICIVRTLLDIGHA